MRKWKGKAVYFLEELQSDWAKGLREFKDKEVFDLAEDDDYNTIPDNPLLKKWQEMALKKALLQAVDKKADYFAWINGEQTSARYNLSTQLNSVKWIPQTNGKKLITLDTKKYGKAPVAIDENGIVIEYDKSNAIGLVREMYGKKLNEVIGKGLADKIMSKESGKLSGKGLKFGGEWAINLYDKQVPNIVKKLTGAEVIEMDMGLPIEKKKESWYTTEETGDYRGGRATKAELKIEDIKVGEVIKNTSKGSFIITKIIKDGKFEAIDKKFLYDEDKVGTSMISDGTYKPITIANKKYYYAREKLNKETFDLFSEKTTTQQGIKLTPEVVATIKGESPKIETSGKKFKPEVKKEIPKTTPIKVRKKIENRRGFSTHYEKIKNAFDFKDSVEIEKVTNKNELRKAYNYAQRNPQGAMQIAYGFKEASAVKTQAIRMSLVASLKEAGKIAQAQEIMKMTSLGFTDIAQALNLAKADLGQKNEMQVTQDITNARLERIGEKLGEVKPEEAKKVVKRKVKAKTQEATKEVVKNQAKMSEETLSDLDNLIDKLLC